jgi:general secretion pathway protein L
MFRDYITWWARQMVELLPPGLRFPDKGSTHALIVEPEGETVTISVRRGISTTKLGRFNTDAVGLAAAAKASAIDGRPSMILLGLRPGVSLEKTLVLPLAVERELERVLSYEMDRETPFSADEVWWSWQVTRRDRQHSQIHVSLFVVPRAGLTGLIEALTHAGLAPTSIDVRAGDGERRQIPLGANRTGREGWSGGLKPLAIGCAALAFIATALPFVRQSLALGRVESRIARLQPEVDRVQALRQQLGAAGANGTMAINQAGTADTLKVLATTTEILPDDTHLTELSLHRRKLSLSGQSGDAAKLIGALAANPLFKDPSFASAVTRPQGSKLDAFSINTEIRQ